MECLEFDYVFRGESGVSGVRLCIEGRKWSVWSLIMY